MSGSNKTCRVLKSNLVETKNFPHPIFELSNKGLQGASTQIPNFFFHSFGQIGRMYFPKQNFMITSSSTRSSDVRARPRTPTVRIGLFVYLSVRPSVCLLLYDWWFVATPSSHPCSYSQLPLCHYCRGEITAWLMMSVQSQLTPRDSWLIKAATPTVTLMLMLTSHDRYSCCSVAIPPQHHDSAAN